MSDSKVDWLVSKRNHMFEYMCLGVHIFLLILFAILQIYGMVVLNIVSTCFYMILILVKRNFSENAVVYSYFEIIFFATVSTILVGRQAGFVLYIVGMISVVFYLAYHHGKKRFLYQGIGVIIVMLLVILEPYINRFFTDYKMMLEPYSRALYIMNLFITLVTVVIVSYLYAQEINRMNHEIIEMNTKLDYQATHDELTGLLNRHEMNQYIDQIYEESKIPIVVSMMDVDDFKQLNDGYGHLAGDLVLKEIAKLMRTYMNDFKVARWGGEEFLIISTCLDKKTGYEKIEKFHNEVSKMSLNYEGNPLDVHLTIGIVYGNNSKDINHMILEADNLLYIGKSHEKNCIVTYENVEEYKKLR